MLPHAASRFRSNAMRGVKGLPIILGYVWRELLPSADRSRPSGRRRPAIGAIMNAVASVGKGDAAEIELTILMPCLNEAETLATCIGKAQRFLRPAGIAGEVLIADNGSTDGSQEIATRAGRARRAGRRSKGYGAALLRRHRRPRAAATSSWATPTTATISARSMPFVDAPARRRRPRHGQPLPGRHRSRRHAAACTAISAIRC